MLGRCWADGHGGGLGVTNIPGVSTEWGNLGSTGHEVGWADYQTSRHSLGWWRQCWMLETRSCLEYEQLRPKSVNPCLWTEAGQLILGWFNLQSADRWSIVPSSTLSIRILNAYLQYTWPKLLIPTTVPCADAKCYPQTCIHDERYGTGRKIGNGYWRIEWV